MKHSIEITSIDDEIRLLSQTGKDEIEEGSKVDHSIDINQNLAKVKDLGKAIKSRTIFKVNTWLRESNPNAYTPKMVSIGPYHKSDVQLDPMGKYKYLYLQRFLRRKEGLDVASCLKELEGLKEEALKCYDVVETDKFYQILLLDGCFVVEFIRECWGMCAEEDKIINSDTFIMRDLILLENQLPFCVLDKLHGMTQGDDEPQLAKLACIIWFPFFLDLQKVTDEISEEITGGNIKHILHLNHVISCHGYRMKKPEDDLSRPMVTSNAIELSKPLPAAGESRHLGHAGNCKDNDDQTWHMVMPNATELSEAGVIFKKANTKTRVFDSIKFENGFLGLMRIPRFRVEDSTETILRNLIAYEQHSVDVEPKYFSDFAILMDKLIESDKDVNLLCHKEIIENWLGDDKAVANLFNKIGNGVLSANHNFYYKEECRKAVKHCKKPWNKMMANLLQNYFSSIWVGTSTVAAIVLLILTFIQTVLSFIK